MKKGDEAGATHINLEKIANFIKLNCSDFLKYKTNLYRGLKGQENEIFISKPRLRPSSVNGAAGTQAMRNADRYMKLAGFKALRSNSIFCNSDISEAMDWGNVFKIYPCNGFTFGYSAKFTCTTAGAYDFPPIKFYKHVRNELMSYSSKYLDKIVDRSDRNTLVKLIQSDEYKEFVIFKRNALYFLEKYKNKFFYNNTDEAAFNNLLVYVKNFKIPPLKEQTQEFINTNELRNYDLKTALKIKHDVWINGVFVAVSVDVSKKHFGFTF